MSLFEQADADEEEFDENDSEFLGEGQFLTAEEKEALLRGGDSSSEDEEEEEVDGMDVEEEEGDRVLPLDEERMGMAAVTPRENAEPADSDRGEDNGNENCTHPPAPRRWRKHRWHSEVRICSG